jgi:NAD(P)-dependent dehydrogenase (short-subunit alcohol dehydrogenase family)
MNLQNAVAFVAGGASGLGAATVHHLVARGAKVAIFDRSKEHAEALAKEIGASTIACPGDVTSEADVGKAIDATIAAFGPLTIAVNTAGVGTVGKLLGKEGPHSLELFVKTITVNLAGTFNVVRLAAAKMVGNAPTAGELGGERGVIINTASIAAFDGQIGQVAYAASKGGVVGMTLPIARELAKSGVRVVTIAPGIFDTPMLAGLPEEARKSLGAQVPFPSRLGSPSEYAALVGHVAENSMLNGEVIRLDGALRMAPR